MTTKIEDGLLERFNDEQIIEFNKWQISRWLRENEHKNSNDQ